MTITFAKVIWLCGVIGWYVIRHPFARKSKKTPIVRRDHKLREFLLLAMSATGLGVLPALYVFTPALSIADYVMYAWQPSVGAAIFAFALYLFHLTHSALGRYWSVTLEIKQQHVLMTEGIYGAIRHPMYAAFWLWALAQAVLLPNAISGPSGLVGFGVLYFFRVRKEELLMLETFGDQYRTYMQQTRRLIPHVY